MPDHSADILIIGAGVSGLAAANLLSAHGKNILLLDARDRLGGRIHTLHDPAWPLPIERGAEFIHGKPKETLSIANAGRCTVYDVADAHWLYHRGQLQKRDDFFDQVEKVLALAEKVPGGPANDLSFNDTLAKFGRRLPLDAIRAAKSFVEGFDAADTRVVSSQWLVNVQRASDKIDGDRLSRLHPGYSSIIDFLRTGIREPRHRIERSTLVRRVEWSKQGATVHTVNAHGGIPVFRARRVLVTVPIGVLQSQPHEDGHIAFAPELPAAKRHAIGLLRMGPVVKVLLHFRDPFWEKAFPDLAFFHAPVQPFPTFWTTLPLRTAILTAWSGGPAAAELSTHTDAAILDTALVTLSTLFKTPRRTLARHLTASHVCNWQTDPLARGAYSFAAVGGAAAPKQLAAPLAGTLFFAGEAAHPGMSGTVAGAIAAGHHAAHQILRAK